MSGRPARAHRALASALFIVLVGALPVSAAGPAMAPGPATAPVEGSVAAPERFILDLYRPGDFVAQTNLVQCVGASMQMMLNIIGPRDDRSAATQRRLFQLARSLRDPTVAGNRTWKGASARGWALGMTTLGAGPYRLDSARTLDEALAVAARAIRLTGRPVGLLVWEGKHAWVMSGFEATADPARDPTAQIVAVRVLDPLYPRSSPRWGASPAPDAHLTVERLARVFVPWRPHSRNTTLRNRYVLVLPYQPSRPATLRIG